VAIKNHTHIHVLVLKNSGLIGRVRTWFTENVVCRERAQKARRTEKIIISYVYFLYIYYLSFLHFGAGTLY